jgi:hypothetical protein
MACTNRDSIRTAARLGMGVLSFAFVDFAEARKWVEEYYTIISTECTPIGYSINPNIAMVSPFYCHEDEAVARERAIEGAQFFQFSLSYYYGFGHHAPGRSNLWEKFVAARPTLPKRQLGIGTPTQLREYLYGFADAGVDQVIFLQPVGRNRHAHICESLELFANRIMPEFQEREKERQTLKMRMLEPGLRAAMARKKPMASLADEAIPIVEPYAAQGAPPASEALRWQLEYTRRIETGQSAKAVDTTD